MKKEDIKILLYIIAENFNKLDINKNDLQVLKVLCKYDLNNKEYFYIKNKLLELLENK